MHSQLTSLMTLMQMLGNNTEDGSLFLTVLSYSNNDSHHGVKKGTIVQSFIPIIHYIIPAVTVWDPAGKRCEVNEPFFFPPFLVPHPSL